VNVISQSDQGCVVETKDGTSYRAAKVILTIPTPLYHTITFQPELPKAKAALSESTKFGYYAKTILVFPSPWWRDAGLSGCLDSETGPFRLARDTACPEEGQYSITCFHVAETGRAWSKLPATERQEAVLKQYRTMFSAVAKDVPEPILVFEKEWPKDPVAPGAGVPAMMPGVLTGDAGRAMRDPVGHVHFAGTETAAVFKGFMEGAIRSGIRGAQEVIAALKSA
jgi:monoamine oxidase